MVLAESMSVSPGTAIGEEVIVVEKWSQQWFYRAPAGPLQSCGRALQSVAERCRTAAEPLPKQAPPPKGCPIKLLPGVLRRRLDWARRRLDLTG